MGFSTYGYYQKDMRNTRFEEEAIEQQPTCSFYFLELHSEELSDQVTELQVESQESELLDSSPSLLSFDTAIDRDVAAQAGQGEPQVFDFDMQVKPLLKVLIGKTVEQALLEVVVEEELAYQWEQQCVYIDQCNAELADVQRLKEQGR
nr:PREDICTED: radial spoke head protein 3 homolog B-like [Apteryx mantelli mantelli]